MEFTKLREVLSHIDDPRGASIVANLIASLDRMIDIGPLAGKNGGQVLFQDSYEALLLSNTKTGRAMSHEISVKEDVRSPKGFLPVRDANIHNLKHVNVDIPLGILTVVTGVAGRIISSMWDRMAEPAEVRLSSQALRQRWFQKEIP